MRSNFYRPNLRLHLKCIKYWQRKRINLGTYLHILLQSTFALKFSSIFQFEIAALYGTVRLGKIYNIPNSYNSLFYLAKKKKKCRINQLRNIDIRVSEVTIKKTTVEIVADKKLLKNVVVSPSSIVRSEHYTRIVRTMTADIFSDSFFRQKKKRM